MSSSAEWPIRRGLIFSTEFGDRICSQQGGFPWGQQGENHIAGSCRLCGRWVSVYNLGDLHGGREVPPICNLLGSRVTRSSDVLRVTFFLSKELNVLHVRTISREAMPMAGRLGKLLSPLKEATCVSPCAPLCMFWGTAYIFRWLFFKHVLLIKIVGERLDIDWHIHHSTPGE